MLKRTRNLLVSRPNPDDTDGFFFRIPDGGCGMRNSNELAIPGYFNVRAFEDVVATVMGAQPGMGVVRIRKLAEGASNKVFTATIRSKRVVVKFPDHVVPSRLVTASEVATLDYLRTELDMHVPRVLVWSSNNDNPVGCEYIIMDEVPGEPLDMVWNTSFRFQEKLALVDQVQSMQSRILQHSSQLGGYGSLYFSKDARAFGFQKELPVRNKNGPLRFCLGPLAHPNFMHSEVERAGISCGPCKLLKFLRYSVRPNISFARTSPEDYLIAAIDCSISRVKSQQEGRKDRELADSCFDFPLNTFSDYSPETALGFLHQYRLAAPSFVPSLSQYSVLTQPVFWHKDLHLGNIFVNPRGIISGIIDWQDTYCLPLFFQAEVPTFSDFYRDSPSFELPHNFSTIPKGDEKKEELARRFLQTKLRQYYLASFSEDSSGISKILENPSWADLQDLAISAAGRSFTRPADFILLRELLLRIERH